VLQDARLIFWEPATHRTLTTVQLPFPAVCPSSQKLKGPPQFTTSFSPDHKTLIVTAYCPSEGGRTALHESWMLTYPTA
ncbi:hypothetical protein ACWDE9_41650, partial [Streptomyces olivaceoviridis]